MRGTQASASPMSLTYSSAGIGSGKHLSGALFVDAAGIALTHVPYIEANIRGSSIGHLAETGNHTGGRQFVP
jgi:tripartite-type tricarboxylate transporter receptor subunit TctC